MNQEEADQDVADEVSEKVEYNKTTGDGRRRLRN